MQKQDSLSSDGYDLLFMLKSIRVSKEIPTEQNHNMDLAWLQIGFVVWAGRTQHTEQVTQKPCDQSGFPALLTYSRVPEPRVCSLWGPLRQTTLYYCNVLHKI